MKHKRFVKLAKEKARNQRGGKRTLAAHVRQLYSAIRELQEDDNAFAYIAEIIQDARADKTDEEAFMHRVKTYYHRDRKALNDPLVVRGPRRAMELARTNEVAAPVDRSAGGIPNSPVMAEEPGGHQDAHPVMTRLEESKAGIVLQRRNVSSSDDRSSLTAALRRPGHRRVATSD